MSKKEKVYDQRVPRPHTTVIYEDIMNFLRAMPSRTDNLYEIKPTETRNFANVSADDANYIKDVLDSLTQQPGLILSHVKVKNIQDATLAAEQYRTIAANFQKWSDAYTRNAMQAEAYAHQQSGIYESDVDSAISSTVSGAQMIKDTLVSNREDRIRRSAATRAANERATAEPKV